MCYYMVGVYRGCGRTIGQEECDVLLYSSVRMINIFKWSDK